MANGVMEPLISSILDTDHYKLTMGQLVFNQFAEVRVRYRFINRGATPFPPGFGEALREQVGHLSHLRLSEEEAEWYCNSVRYMKPTYIEWLRSYRYNPNEVQITQNGGELEIGIEGLWYRSIFWEVPLLALVSELYFRMSGLSPDNEWEQRLREKTARMAAAGLHWIDFGTRRRYSLAVQDRVNALMKEQTGLFLGTSNPYVARKHNIVPVGTYAHEGPMAMQSLYGVRACNRMWMDAWVREYHGDLGIALTDTVTTPVFLRDFDMYQAKLFDGVRIDSGDPVTIGEMILAHYARHRIPTISKRMVFSDSLNDKKAIALHRHFSSRCMMMAGIGTFLTNDCGHRPLNIVIKLTEADFGAGYFNLVKLSDDTGKHTGQGESIDRILAELGLPAREQ